MKEIVWELHTLWPWKKVKLIDGSEQRGGLVLRCKKNNIWYYCAPTPEEQAFQDWFDEQW
jgi:hypothetical protein